MPQSHANAAFLAYHKWTPVLCGPKGDHLWEGAVFWNVPCGLVPLRPIYTVRFLLTIVACDFCSTRCLRHEKIVYDFHDIKLPVATIVVGF